MRAVLPHRLAVLCAAIAATAMLFIERAPSAEPFPEGTPGELYYAPRVDRNPVKNGGPLTVELDGDLNDEVWQRAAFHGFPGRWPGGTAPIDEVDLTGLWAAVADEERLYIAWKVVDAERHAGEQTGCAVFGDDTMEIYFDADGNGITCGNCGYSVDDAQLLVSAGEIGNVSADELEIGWVRGGGCVFSGIPIDNDTGENIIRGLVTEYTDENESPGWQGEISIALSTMTHGQWAVDPIHGTTIGFDMHLDDDDNGGGQDAGADTALIWSNRDTTSTAWQTPGVWGKLQFITPSIPLAEVTRDIPDGLRNGTSGTVSLTVRPNPVFGFGAVKIIEKLPDGFTPSEPSGSGVVAANSVTWDLGVVQQEVTVTYTLTPGADVGDVILPGIATMDGEPLAIGGDRRYTGSPITNLGFIKLWNHLGPLTSGLSDNTTCNLDADIALDWIQNGDGSITERTIAPFEGLQTSIQYGGDGQPGGGARATGLRTATKTVVDQFPRWTSFLSKTDTVNHDEVHGFDANDAVTLSCVYVTNNTGSLINTQIGVGSDENIVVYLNDEPIGQSIGCRTWGAANSEQDFFPITLATGESRVLVKVADGGGVSGFRLRFQDPGDPTGPGLVPPALTVSLASKDSPPPAGVARNFSSDDYPLGGKVDVGLTATIPGARGEDITIVEALPNGAAATDVSDAGQVDGNTIVWTVPVNDTRTVTYKLAAGSCTIQPQYGFSTWQKGPFNGPVLGESSLNEIGGVKDGPVGVWTSVDIGPAAGAVEALAEHDARIQAGGAGVKGTKDECRFVYVRAAGDFAISTSIDCMDDPGGAGLGGLMVRDTLDPYSAMVYLALAAGTGAFEGTLKGNFRRETNALRPASSVPISDKDVTALPIHLRLRRAAGKVLLERSADGTQYTEIGSREIGTGQTQVNLKDDVLIGLAATGTGDTARYTFRSLSGPPVKEVGQLFRRANADSSTALDISDPVFLLTYLFLGGGRPACLDAADADDSGTIDLTDAVFSLNFQFLAGPTPPDPGPNACGIDPTPDADGTDLGCVTPQCP